MTTLHRTLYEITGDIKDMNTLLVPRSALAQQGEQPTYAELLDYVERLEASQKYLQGPAKSIVLGLVDDYAAAATNYYQGKETKELWEKMVAARKLVEDALK